MKHINSAEVKKELALAINPLILYDDDPDGLCSFLQVYKFIGNGHGYIVKKSPRITEEYLNKVEEYGPDKIIILDIVMVDQEFIDKVRVPIIWIDHHDPQNRSGVLYHNPRVKKSDNNIPTSLLCYNALKKNLWIATAGAVSDWYFPKTLAKKFSIKYPELLPDSIDNVEDALFGSKLGKLIRVLAFNLKGKSSDVFKSVKILSRIEDPREILDRSTPQGKFIYNRYDKINKIYEHIKKQIFEVKPDNGFVIFTYSNSSVSTTKELANEALYHFKDKIILVGRISSGDVKMSIRSSIKELPDALQHALQGVEGYGGGHEHACGALVKEEDFNQFIINLKRELSS